MNFSRKQKRVLIGMLYNLILELWVHGFPNFIQPELIISLIFLYLSYFAILEDLIVRYHYRDKQILLYGFTFGFFHETFTTGSVFSDHFILGLNPILILLANIVWWGILQAILGRYFAITLISTDQNEKPMGLLGWFLSVGFNLFLFIVRIFENSLPPGDKVAYTICIVILFLGMISLKFAKKFDADVSIPRLKAIDLIIRIQIGLCFIFGILLFPIIGIIRLYLFILWSVIIAGVFLIFKLRKCQFIGVITSSMENR